MLPIDHHTNSTIGVVFGGQVTSIKLFFEANDKNGTPGINYVLDLLDGVITGATWPAADDGTSTITGGKFTLAHSNGPGNKDGCKAKDIDLAFMLSVTEN